VDSYSIASISPWGFLTARWMRLCVSVCVCVRVCVSVVLLASAGTSVGVLVLVLATHCVLLAVRRGAAWCGGGQN
jgi:hypothetical protein